MEKTIKINLTELEVAEALFNLDNKQVAKVFSEWKRLFDEEYERKKSAKEPIWIFDLNHFMLHVIDELDEDGINFFRTTYASMLYKMVDDIHKKHLVEFNLTH